jgi:hypothetical protein
MNSSEELSDISEALLDGEIRELILNQVKLLEDQERKKAAKESGQVCPPSWTDVSVDGEVKCQGYNERYGSCPSGYTSFGSKCVILTDDIIKLVASGEFKLPEEPRFKQIDPSQPPLIDPNTGFIVQVPADPYLGNERAVPDFANVSAKEPILDSKGNKTGDFKKIFKTKWIPNKFLSFNGPPISLEEAKIRSGKGELGGFISYD